MKIAITGGSGFIGTNLVEYFINLGYNVINIDIAKPKNRDYDKNWIQLDILNFDLFSNKLKEFNPNYIIHLAARTDLDEKKNIKGYDTNIQGVDNLMNICSELKDLNRVIIASSMLVCKLGYIPTNGFDYCPNTIYGESKVLTEKIVRRFEKIDWILVRPTSIWGPWFGAPYNNFFRLVRNSKYLNLSKKRAAIKTYGYVKNTCLQIHSLMLCKDKNVIHDYFYLGDVHPINISDWADLICECENKRKPIVIPSIILKIAGFVGDILQRVGIPFPMSSFRFNNMTTNHIIDLSKTLKIVENNGGNDSQNNLYTNTKETINWLNKNKNK